MLLHSANYIRDSEGDWKSWKRSKSQLPAFVSFIPGGALEFPRPRQSRVKLCRGCLFRRSQSCIEIIQIQSGSFVFLTAATPDFLCISLSSFYASFNPYHNCFLSSCHPLVGCAIVLQMRICTSLLCVYPPTVDAAFVH